MSEERNKIFHIRYGDRKYAVMPTKMHRDIFLAGDPVKAGKFLATISEETMIPNTELYMVLMKMVDAYDAKREEFTVGGRGK